MKLNRYEKKIIKGIIASRKGIYETPRQVREKYKTNKPSKTKPLKNLKEYAIAGVIIFMPAVFIVLQGDTGSALVFATFILVLFREGLSPVILIIGLVAVTLFILTLIFDKIILFIGIGAIVAIFVFIFSFIKE